MAENLGLKKELEWVESERHIAVDSCDKTPCGKERVL